MRMERAEAREEGKREGIKEGMEKGLLGRSRLAFKERIVESERRS